MKIKIWPTSKVMQFSLLTFIACIVLSILSMGYLGMGLFYIASPALELFYSGMPKDLNTWNGDWVWPAMIGMPILWSIGWLISGRIYLHLDTLDWTNLTKKTCYIVILLAWNLVIWLILLLILKPEIT